MPPPTPPSCKSLVPPLDRLLTLSLAAAKLPAYQKLIDTAVEFGKSKSSNLEEQAENAMDRLLVAFGVEILKIVPGRVSTEVDAAFSFDAGEWPTSIVSPGLTCAEATKAKARQIIALYEEQGVSKDRVLIKVCLCLTS